MSVQVVSHDATWPERFEAERLRLLGALGPIALRVEHVGSTSVPGLAAKPVIDILVGIADLASLDAREADMRAAGYQVKGEHGLPGRRYFRREAGDGTRLVHVHAYAFPSAGFHRHLVFRDYLRRHPVEAARYGAHKQALAASGDLAGQDYQSAKSAFVEVLEARALAWAAR